MYILYYFVCYDLFHILLFCDKIMDPWNLYTGYTQKNGAVSIVFTIETAPFLCVYPVCIYVCMDVCM
jgi:hypothetical protein